MNINIQKHKAVGATVHNVHNLHAAELIHRATSLGILLYIVPPICTTSKIRVVEQLTPADDETILEVSSLKAEISAAIKDDRQGFMCALIDHYRSELAELATEESLPGRASAAGMGGGEGGGDSDNSPNSPPPAIAYANAIRRQRTTKQTDDPHVIFG